MARFRYFHSHFSPTLIHILRIFDTEWHPNSQFLAVATDTGIWIYDSSLQVLGHIEDGGRFIKWKPNGLELAVVGRNIRIFNSVNLNNIYEVLEIERVANTYEAAWHPSENKLAVINGQLIQIWNTLSGNKLDEFKSNEFTIETIDWSPDGFLIASANEYESTVHIWDVQARQLTIIISHPTTIGSVKWSSDGQQLAISGGNDIHIWNKVTQTGYLLHGHTQGVKDVDWSIDRLASVGLDKRILVWDVHTWEVIKEIESEQFLDSIEWSANGAYLVYWGRNNKVLQIVPVASR